jgi:GTP-binding protein
VQEHKKGMIVCWNKWDLVEKDPKTFDTLAAETKRTYKEMQYIPMVSVSALTGQRVMHVVDMALQIRQNMTLQIKQADLDEMFFGWVKKHPHPFVPNREVRFLGIKQMHGQYPHFILFCTNHNSVFPSYKRFLSNKLQEAYDFSGCPLILSFRPPSQQSRKKATIHNYVQEKEF